MAQADSNDLILASDSNNDGVGDIVLKTGTNERARIKADGTGTGLLGFRTRLSAPGAICFTGDDGPTNHYTQVAPALEAAGMRGTFGIVSDFIGTTQGSIPMMSAAQILDLANRGHEIASHSKTHTDVTSLSVANQTIEYDTSKTVIEGIIGTGKCTTFVYPFGTRSATTDSFLATRYDRVRGTTGGTSAAPNWMVPVRQRDDFVVAGITWDGTTTQHANVLDAIRLAARIPVIVVVYFHSIDTASNPTTAQFNEAVALAQSLGVPGLTMKEAFPGGNLVRDANFDSGALGSWVNGSTGSAVAEIIANPDGGTLAGLGYKNTNVAHLNCTNVADQALLRQYIPAIEPSESYQLSFRYKVAGTPGAGVTGVVREKDYAGATISQTATAGLTSTTWVQGAAARATGDTARTCWIDFLVLNVVAEMWVSHVYLQKKTYGAQG